MTSWYCVKPIRIRQVQTGGGGRIRTSEVYDGRFTVCSLWPLGNPSRGRYSLGSALGAHWSWRQELNPQPADYKSAALPIELRQHKTGFIHQRSRDCKNFLQFFAPAEPLQTYIRFARGCQMVFGIFAQRHGVWRPPPRVAGRRPGWRSLTILTVVVIIRSPQTPDFGASFSLLGAPLFFV